METISITSQFISPNKSFCSQDYRKIHNYHFITHNVYSDPLVSQNRKRKNIEAWKLSIERNLFLTGLQVTSPKITSHFTSTSHLCLGLSDCTNTEERRRRWGFFREGWAVSALSDRQVLLLRADPQPVNWLAAQHRILACGLRLWWPGTGRKFRHCPATQKWQLCQDNSKNMSSFSTYLLKHDPAPVLSCINEGYIAGLEDNMFSPLVLPVHFPWQLNCMKRNESHDSS